MHKARELRMPQGLSKAHRKVQRSVRDIHAKSGRVPTVFECCEINGLEIEDLERLFPDGYQRGAVKLSDLRVM